MKTKFTPSQKTLMQLFEYKTTYIIPEYQRPYAWDCEGKSDKNNQVNVMWNDLVEFYESKNPNEYFLGSIVVIPNTQTNHFEVIDGQQRLTTLILLFTAIKCFLEEFKKTSSQEKLIDYYLSELKRIIFFDSGPTFGLEKKVKIERSIGFDYDFVLKMALDCGKYEDIKDKISTPEQEKIAKRYFNNRDFFKKCLAEKFLNNNTLIDEKIKELQGFLTFLQEQVTVIRIDAADFQVAYQVFEVLNNRGLPLSNKDLFRNFIIKEFFKLKTQEPKQKQYESLDPNEKWIALDDEKYQFDTEFMNRYVESKQGKNQKLSAFNDLEKEIYNKNFEDHFPKKKIELFYEDIEKNLKIYTQITNGYFENKKIKNIIYFLLASGNKDYIINLLMALLRCTQKEEEILKFLKQFEHYILLINLGFTKRFKTKIIYDLIKAFNEKKIAKTVEILSAEISEEDLRKYLDQPIFDNDIAKLMIMRYFCAVDNLTEEDVVEQMIDYNKATLEHIMPQNPAKDSNWVKDFSPKFRKDWTYKLANFTLLTKKMNISNGNFDFSAKKENYKKSKLILTQSLAKIEKINKEFFEKRQAEILETLYQDLEI